MDMKWPKDRKKAFLWAAKAFGTPRAERTERQKELTIGGICFAIYKLTDSSVGSDWIVDLKHKMGIWHLYWWPIRGWRSWRTIHDKQRSRFCYLMAALSKKEFEEISG